MKIRNDFVSNSSSSSFMVKDVAKLYSVLEPLGEMPWEYDEFSVYVTCKLKNYDKVYEELTGEKYEPWRPVTNFNPEEESNVCISDYNTFISRYGSAPKKIKDAITGFTLECSNNNSPHVGMLNMLFDLCELEGLEPDDKYTEINFRPGKAKNDDNFITRLSKRLTQHSEKKNG